jgi:putative transposase
MKASSTKKTGEAHPYTRPASMSDMEKAFKYRFYPTPAQANLLRRTLGCVRLVYNRMLATRTEAWYQRQERIRPMVCESAGGR